VSTSRAYDPDLHDPGTVAASGRCSHHAEHDAQGVGCTGDAVVSFQDQQGRWQSGCAAALEQLVADGQIDGLGQGA
jgi:hypothetical protein